MGFYILLFQEVTSQVAPRGLIEGFRPPPKGPPYKLCQIRDLSDPGASRRRLLVVRIAEYLA